MIYREVGRTGVSVSEIGLGAEWLERKDYNVVKEVIDCSESHGINILDCWMAEPQVRSNIGKAIEGKRDKWYIQGHIGSIWKNGQYVRSRKMNEVKNAFNDLLKRLGTEYIDFGMIHFVDEIAEFNKIMNSEFIEYVNDLKKSGIIRHIGLSTHNPDVAKLAALSGKIELILFSINPAFDMLPASEDINVLFNNDYSDDLKGIAPEREELYGICEREGVGITVMKGYAGGRLFKAETSPFKVALTPVQCLHYSLTRPAVASVMAGCCTVQEVEAAVEYENATSEQKDYASVLANAPKHSYSGQCTYCGHCSPCPVYIDIAMVNKLYDLALMHEEVSASILAHYNSLSSNASDCTGCRACEKRCPFDVKVVERFKEASEFFSKS